MNSSICFHAFIAMGSTDPTPQWRWWSSHEDGTAADADADADSAAAAGGGGGGCGDGDEDEDADHRP